MERKQNPHKRTLFKELRESKYRQRVGWGHKQYKRKHKYNKLDIEE